MRGSESTSGDGGHADPAATIEFRLSSAQSNLSCGIDLVDIDRIADMVLRYGERFLRRVWTEAELAICRGRYPELAARFAGKEATMKALGTGIRGVGWREIEILRDKSGKPILLLHGGAAQEASLKGLTTWSISLTHSRLMASAVVVVL